MNVGDNPGHVSRELNQIKAVDNREGSVIPSKKKEW